MMADVENTAELKLDASVEPAPVEEDPDQVTATRKFNWQDPETETTRTFFPGQVIDDPDAAEWALDQLHGEQRGLQSPSRSMAAPENKGRSLEDEGGENKKAGKRKR